MTEWLWEHRGRFGGGEPAPFSGDGDGYDLVLRRVCRLDDRVSRTHRDLVLARAAAEDQHQTNLSCHSPSPVIQKGALSRLRQQLRAPRLRIYRNPARLKNRLAQRGEDQLDAQLGRAVVDVERSVYLDYFEREDAAGLCDLLHREVRLAVGQAAADDRARPRRVARVERVHVERHMIAGRGLRGDVDGLVHAGGHPPLVYLAHGEETHAEPPYQ